MFESRLRQTYVVKTNIVTVPSPTLGHDLIKEYPLSVQLWNPTDPDGYNIEGTIISQNRSPPLVIVTFPWERDDNKQTN